jgi:hypothetical protein
MKYALDAGCKALLVTADSPVLGTRWNETRNNFAIPPHLELAIIGDGKLSQGKSSREILKLFNGWLLLPTLCTLCFHEEIAVSKANRLSIQTILIVGAVTSRGCAR